MKKAYKLKNLGCANCAAKMETGISKIKGVESCAIAFMTSRLTIEADEGEFERILEEAGKIIHKYERNCEIQR